MRKLDYVNQVFQNCLKTWIYWRVSWQCHEWFKMISMPKPNLSKISASNRKLCSETCTTKIIEQSIYCSRKNWTITDSAINVRKRSNLSRIILIFAFYALGIYKFWQLFFEYTEYYFGFHVTSNVHLLLSNQDHLTITILAWGQIGKRNNLTRLSSFL